MSANPIAAMAGGVGDPRLPYDDNKQEVLEDPELKSTSGAIRPQHRRLHDPAVTFEEYHYYALKTRAEENEAAQREQTPTTFKNIIFPPKNGPGATPEENEKRRTSVTVNLAKKENRLEITDDEWTNASRALRTATWAACFYLITTDILGPFGVGYVRMLRAHSATS